MKYEVKSYQNRLPEVYREGTKIADIEADGSLVMLEGQENYRVQAIKLLKEMSRWDVEANKVIMVLESKEVAAGETDDDPPIGGVFEELERDYANLKQEIIELTEMNEALVEQNELLKAENEKLTGKKLAEGKKTKPAPRGINTTRELIAAMQPGVEEPCPAMNPGMGDQTPAVVAWIKKYDVRRRKVLGIK